VSNRTKQVPKQNKVGALSAASAAASLLRLGVRLWWNKQHHDPTLACTIHLHRAQNTPTCSSNTSLSLKYLSLYMQRHLGPQASPLPWSINRHRRRTHSKIPDIRLFSPRFWALFLALFPTDHPVKLCHITARVSGFF